MKIQTYLLCAACFVIGWSTASLWSWSKSDDPNSTKFHWDAIQRFNEYYSNPHNRKTIPSKAIDYVVVPFDIHPHLAALVAAHEIECVELIFPTVPADKSANRIWQEWFRRQTSDDVIYVESNSYFTDYETTGIQPLLLRIWVRPSAQTEIQKLIRTLEGRADDPIPIPASVEIIIPPGIGF